MSSTRTWQKSLARLARMSREEFLARAGQEFAKRLDAALYGAGIKLGTNVPIDSSGHGAHFFFETSGVPELVVILRARLPEECDLLLEQAERILQHRFDLLGYCGLDYGPEIDWHLDAVHQKRAPFKRWYAIRYLNFDEVGDHKIIWELNRHQHLVTLAKAYRLTNDKRFAVELLAQWHHWWKANPYPTGINWASSLEVAFRSLSWIWAQHLLLDSPDVPQSFHAALLRAQRLNGRHISRYLSTYFSPNTHLLGEAVALFFIGLLYPQIPESRLWQQTGWETTLREAERQVRPDGLHFEESVYYHVYALDLFLHARLLASRNDIPIPRAFDQKLEKMMEVLVALGRMGAPPRIGDDDGGRVFNPRRNRAEHMLDPLSTGAAIFGRAVFKAAAGGLREETVWLLGRKGVETFDAIQPSELPATSAQLASGGIYVMVSSPFASERLVVAAGPQQRLGCGHAHADALSVQLAVNGSEWLIDPGAYGYIVEPGQREFFRGTGAHNTLEVDELDQSERAGPFAWASPITVDVDQWVAGKTFDLFAGSHNGYSRLPQPVVHERWVVSIKDGFWFVRDLARGEGKHRLDISWHLASGFSPRCTGESSAVRWTRDNESLTLLPAEGHGWSQQIAQGKNAPVYGKQEPTYVLKFRKEARLPAEFGVLVLPIEEATAPVGVLERIDDGTEDPVVRAYRYARLDESHVLFFAKPGQRWDLKLWSSDARFVYCGMAGQAGQHWVLCGGSYLEINGHRVIECTHAVERFEWMSSGPTEEISCSDPSAINHVPGDVIASPGKILPGQGMGESPRRAN